MNAGNAVIASDRVGAAPDLVSDGVNGFVFHAGDVETLRDRWARLTNEMNLVVRMGKASRVRITGWNFEAERTDTHEELFEDGKQAVLFTSPAELAEKVRYYLPRDEERLRIAGAGRTVILAGRHSYGDRLMQIMNAVSPLLVRHRMAGSEPMARAMVR